MSYYVHFVHEERGLLAKKRLVGVPCVGDEIRFPQEKYYRVTLVVWVMDEPECPMQRINIRLLEAE